MNTEWCNFGSSRRTLPCTWFDRKLARESINPQFHVFEKMTTGIFLGELVRNILIYLVDRDILFGGESSETLNTAHSFDTSYMYVCEADDSETLEDTRIVLEDMLDLSKTTVGDREVVKKVCELIGTRAAVLVGASIAAIVQHMTAKGIGMTEEGYAICKSQHDRIFYLASILIICHSHQRKYIRRLSIIPSPCVQNHQGLDSWANCWQALGRCRQAFSYCGSSHCRNDGGEDCCHHSLIAIINQPDMRAITSAPTYCPISKNMIITYTTFYINPASSLPLHFKTVIGITTYTY